MKEHLVPTSGNSPEGNSEEIQTIDDLINFFIDNEDNPELRGYSKTAISLKNQLSFIALAAWSKKANEFARGIGQHSNTDEKIVRVELELRPEATTGQNDATDRGGTAILMDLGHKVTGASSRVLHQEFDEQGNLESTILCGSYDGEDIYFLVSEGQGKITWEAMTGVPDSFLPSAPITPARYEQLGEMTERDIEEIRDLDASDIIPQIRKAA